MLTVGNMKKITRRIIRNSASYNLAVSPFFLTNIARSQLAVSTTLLQKLSSVYWKTERGIAGGIGIG